MNPLTMVVIYTRDDDGIWLDCQCGQLIEMGYFPTVEEIALQAAIHRKVTHTEFPPIPEEYTE